MTRFFVKHPVTTWMIFGAFAVLALYALPRIEVEALPEVDLPTLTVTTVWNGASPQAVQQSITLPIEEAARSVDDVENVVSTSSAGRSRVEIELTRDAVIDFARLELNEALGSVRRNLPLGAIQPQITTFVPEEFETEGFFIFSIESDLEPNELRERCEQWIVPQVLGIEGVADARVVGGALPLVKVLLDRQKLRFYGITSEEIFTAINDLDLIASAGAVLEGGAEKLVSLRDRVSVDDLRKAIVARRGDVNFTVGMLGDVVAGHEDPTNFARSNAKSVVQVRVEKRSGGNSIAVSRDLREALPELEASVPFDATLRVETDQGEELEDKLTELLVRSGIILLVLFLLLAISLRQVVLTAIVIGSVLFALVICLSLFYFLQLSVNFITISGLTICFGLLLDNSILVLDSVHRRIESLDRANRAGLSRRAKLRVVFETVVEGTTEVIFPILTTTLTTIVAFLSFIFLSGRLALYYVPLAVSVALAMLASIFVAFGWIPVVLKQAWASRLARRSPDGPNELADDGQLQRIVHVLPDLSERLSWPRGLLAFNQVIWPAAGGAGRARLVRMEGLRRGRHQGWLLRLRQRRDPVRVRPDAGRDGRPGHQRNDLQVRTGTCCRSRTACACGRTCSATRARSTSSSPTNRSVRRCRCCTGTSWWRSPISRAGAFVFIRGFSDQPYFKGSFGGSALNSLIKITGYNSKVLRGDRWRNTGEGLAQSTRAQCADHQQRPLRAASNEETVVRLKRDVLGEYGLSVLQVVQQVRRLLGVDTPWRMIVDGEQEAHAAVVRGRRRDRVQRGVGLRARDAQRRAGAAR